MDWTMHRGFLPGAIGRIVEMHAGYYSAQAGFGTAFEILLARGLADFCERYDEEHDGLWLARAGGGIVGAIAVDGHEAGDEGAHLRWFIMQDDCRGQGIGGALLAAAVDFCRARHGGRAHLWTFEGLDAARRLYEKAGFRLVAQQRGNRWGAPVNEQRYVLGGAAG